jgi:hypothetical protein
MKKSTLIVVVIVLLILVGLGAFLLIRNLNIFADTASKQSSSLTQPFSYLVKNDDGSTYLVYLRLDQDPIVRATEGSEVNPAQFPFNVTSDYTSVSSSSCPGSGCPGDKCKDSVNTVVRQLNTAASDVTPPLQTIVTTNVVPAIEATNQIIINLKNHSPGAGFDWDRFAKSTFMGILSAKAHELSTNLLKDKMKSTDFSRWDFKTCGQSHNGGVGGNSFNVDFNLSSAGVTGRLSVALGGVRASAAHVVVPRSPGGPGVAQESRSSDTSLSFTPMKQDSNHNWIIDAGIPGSSWSAYGAYSVNW